ncbi:unnamed protein product [Rotaria socialis]|uniref:dTDP-D-glucose 4,6-dehydratase n=1 Tax=Rotaria socialis TaxID=392032 RepID=A0A820GNM3_9BILA|nr:unnamed protein product [Rotaria socialis]CAF3434438.1 unnamed protein product [Rotaria socialis]CAF3440332.1 unnamed protein product [Rotaria socialis]CAF3631552.1 unnamed protein product [Rotaria socialis]CAF3721751.1 unnamed protein product [Rotaria socialis]
MLWLVYGTAGWIGGQCRDLLHVAGQKVITGRRIASLKDVEDDIATYKPDRVICAIGRTHGEGVPNIDYLEKPGKLKDNMRDNLLAPMFIAQATMQHDKLSAPIPTLYFGTGCIYELENLQDTSHPFTENDQPNFFGSSYSTVKGATDLLIDAYPHVINARIRMPISDEPNPRDFITKILGYKKITSLPNSMTVMSDVLPILLAITHDGKFGGRVNACNKGWVDHDWILKTYQEKTGEILNYELEPAEEQSARLAARRSNNVLTTDKLEQWLKLLSPDTRKLYYTPHILPELKKSIEAICLHRANMKASYTLEQNEVRRLLVTGGCGFIGSNFINYWLKAYPQDYIVNVDKLDTCSNIHNVEQSDSPKYKLVVASINNKDLMLHLMKQYDITHVVHFAAQTHVDTSFGNSILFTESNIFGTHCLLEASRIYNKLRKFIHISTDEVYGEWPAGSCHETAVLNPTNPYAATKAAAEFLVKSYGESFKLPYVITRGNNVYGPYQFTEKVIPRFITLIMNDEKMTIQGDGKQVRNFIYVTDTVRAVDLVIRKGKLKMIYNIGSKDEIKVMEIATILLKLMKPEAKVEDYIIYVKDRYFNDCRYSVMTDALESLGWKQEIKFDEGIRETIKWYQEHPDHWQNEAT